MQSFPALGSFPTLLTNSHSLLRPFPPPVLENVSLELASSWHVGRTKAGPGRVLPRSRGLPGKEASLKHQGIPEPQPLVFTVQPMRAPHANLG